MMTKEEYQKELVRMFDSLRDDKFKGETHCRGIECIYCPLYHKACNAVDGGVYGLFNALEIIEKWSREHQIVTNSDKFKEVFGFKPYTKNCINGEEKVSCANCQCFYDGECAVQNRFWENEYKPTKEGEE